MDFLDDEEDDFDEEIDMEEEEYYKNMHGKSVSKIYSKIHKNKKEIQKNLPQKTQEEIEMHKSLIEARNNSIKNAMLRTSSNVQNNYMLGKKRYKGLLFNENNSNRNDNNNINNKNGNKKNHQGNNNSKKKVNFIMNKNTVTSN